MVVYRVLVSGWSVGFFYFGLRVNERDEMTGTTAIFNDGSGNGSASSSSLIF
ncbi:hypothetical protein Patl1_32179 [Pistacia atlantica]|uniref:Uncharacterized protein n=1 Tax=Pistacia atlantica TaxID=434234 RepID=A0ACC1ANI7_9ROSI|nr:hypothetical protein Patl1_32179 [Pistacia atlantica]